MELFMIAAVLIIVFNLFNALSKQGKQKQPPAPRQQNPFADMEAIPLEPRLRERLWGVRLIEPDLPRETALEALRQEPPAVSTDDAPAAPVPPVAAQPSAHPSGVMHGLTGMLQEQDRLVAAFVFHEIMSPPRSKRH